MIKVKRTACPDGLDPGNSNAAGPRELARVKQMLANGEVLKSSDFSAYADFKVREALRKMFFGKCAYCEAKIASTQDGDVEHYRPKKGVTEADKAGVPHTGYWWLAMVWENLMLSCQHCNQARSKQIIIPDHIETEAELAAFLIDPPRQTAGKLNSFPIGAGTWVTDPTGNIATENPLILEPTSAVDPEDHLEWVLFKGASTVRAKNGSPQGEATRKILGLNRRDLEENRRMHLRLMRNKRNKIIDAVNNWLTADIDAVKDVWGQVADGYIEELLQMTEVDQPFAAMAAAFLSAVQAEVKAMRQTSEED